MYLRLLSLVILLEACNEVVLDTNTGPCERTDCGRSCTQDSDCDSKTYCNASGACTADCTPGGNQCTAGTVCTFRGRCVAPPPEDGGNCPSVVVDVKPVVPLVQLLIDQSGSMTAQFGTVNGQALDRWQAVRYALTNQTAGAVTKLQDRVRFGATLYYSRGGNRNGATCPLLTRSTGMPAGLPQLNNRAAIDALLANNKPDSDTPTAESVDATARDIAEYAKSVPAGTPRVLILATDGDPDTCPDPDSNGSAASQALSEKAVQNAYAAGVRTYVLSVGPDASRPHLRKLANAGAGKPLTPDSEAFYQGNNPAELVNAFGTILRGVRTCTFMLNGDVSGEGVAQAKVTLNGKALAYGTDWTLMGSRTLVLQGGSCDTFKAAETATLSAEFPCGTVLF
jgi:hypothetical protein